MSFPFSFYFHFVIFFSAKKFSIIYLINYLFEDFVDCQNDSLGINQYFCIDMRIFVEDILFHYKYLWNIIEILRQIFVYSKHINLHFDKYLSKNLNSSPFSFPLVLIDIIGIFVSLSKEIFIYILRILDTT